MNETEIPLKKRRECNAVLGVMRGGNEHLGLGVMRGGNEHLDQWSGPRNFSLGARVRSSKLAFLLRKSFHCKIQESTAKYSRAVELGKPKHQRSMGG